MTCRTLSLLLAALLLPALIGCGGGGSGPSTPPAAVDLTAALRTPWPTAPVAADAGTAAALTLDENTPPQTLTQLRARLAYWTPTAAAHPDDSGAQLGLVLSLLEGAGRNASTQIGYDLFGGLTLHRLMQQGLANGSGAGILTSQALQVAALSGLPQLQADTVQTAAVNMPSPAQLALLQNSLRDYVIPVLDNAITRLGYLASRADGSVVLAPITYGGSPCHLYRVDAECLQGSLQRIRALLVMVVGVNLNYGSFDWQASLGSRDANHDGVLTPGEYAPGAPFGDVAAALWQQAGTDMHDGSALILHSIQNHHATDSAELLVMQLRRIHEADYTQLLTDTVAALAGPVTMTVVGANAAGAPQLTTSTPVNLRAMFATPPSSLRSILPTLNAVPAHPGQWAPVWDTFPSKTLMGLFSDQTKVKQLFADNHYAKCTFTYGAFSFALSVPIWL
ncbi:MAG TPA: hypothetical protein VGM19_13675 [Armatimonadota bacterium]|jgi:hypothetical protein